MFVESTVFPAQSIWQMGVYFVDWLAMGTFIFVVWLVFPIPIYRYSFQYRFPLSLRCDRALRRPARPGKVEILFDCLSDRFSAAMFVY